MAENILAVKSSTVLTAIVHDVGLWPRWVSKIMKRYALSTAFRIDTDGLHSAPNGWTLCKAL
jgi:hypothetical protein